jgi:hypothetical protein
VCGRSWKGLLGRRGSIPRRPLVAAGVAERWWWPLSGLRVREHGRIFVASF